MSSLCHCSEFQRHFNSYLAAYSLADQWQRGDAMRNFVNMLTRLGYFRVGKSTTTTKNTPMVEVQGFFSLARTLPDLVQIDLATLWKQSTADCTLSVHAFENDSTGFDGHFMTVSDGSVLTYKLRVEGLK